MVNSKKIKTAKRILQFLKINHACSLNELEGQETCKMLKSENGQSLAITKSQLKELRSAGALTIKNGTVFLSRSGQSLLIRLSLSNTNEEKNLFGDQHRDLAKAEIKMNGTAHTVSINLAESPLSRLRKRKSETGEPFISDHALAAGERLRADFTKSQLAPRVTANWDPSLVSGKSSGASMGGNDVSDRAVDARSRTNEALNSMGPDLSGVVTDVCCFLKGLETVERDRKWPPRSAKIMLRAGLELLARHYGFVTVSRPA